jgi:cell division protein FtsB
MKAKRETQKRRAVSDRRDRRDGASRKDRRTAADSASSRRTRPGRSSAPTREARAPKSGPQTSPIARPVERSARPKSTTQAKARAKARKAKAPKVVRPRLTERLAIRLASIDLRPRTLASKVPFVVLVIGALGLGLGLTLWLSTDSAERSYQLSHARAKNRLLQQQKESLERDVREAESAPALAEAARKQGMIPTRDTAHLVQDPAGNWVVVGTPKPADGVPPPPLNTKLPEPGPPPPPKPPVLPPEVAVRVQPGPGGPPAPTRSGPEALLRAPDGSTTVGGQHLPQTAPQLPGMPGGPVTGQIPGVMPMPGLPAPTGPATAPAPAEVPIPLGGLPVPVPTPAPAPLPAEVPVPVQPGAGARAPQAVVPVVPVAPALAPASGEQFGPPTFTTPGAPR